MDEEGTYQEVILLNEAYFVALIADIDTATQTINLETYIFYHDEVGQRVTDALCRAAKRGVRIQVLVDGIGTPDWGNELTMQMEQVGIKTRVYHPAPWIIRHWNRTGKSEGPIISKIISLFSKVNSRNHRKTCVIDNTIMYVGSANIIQAYVAVNKNTFDSRETMVKFENAETHELQYAFEKAWGDVPIKKRFYHFIRRAHSEPMLRLNYSLRRRRVLYRSLLNRISLCHERIWVTNAYFIPDNFLLRRLVAAAKRGVDVRILLPGKYDIFAFSFVAKTFYQILFDAGVAIYEYMPRILHAKVLILDKWYCVGSSNLNYRSIKHDLEVDVNVRTHHAKEELERQFLIDLQSSVQITKDSIQQMSLLSRWVGRFLLLLKNWM